MMLVRMPGTIDLAAKDDYKDLIGVWEDSVRATHDFLEEDDIQRFKILILNGKFDTVSLYCLRDPGENIAGFLGVSDDNIDMLFVASAYRGKHVGKALLRYAVDTVGVRKLDVNEQNEQAIGFYEHLGFSVVSRSPLDGQGRPFPLLHMELQ